MDPKHDLPVLDELVTAEVAAAAMKVTIRTIRNWIADGTLPAYRIGAKAIRIKRSDLDALLKPVKPGGAS